MLKVYGNPLSTCTRAVLVTIAELGLAHEFVSIDFAKGEHKGPEHLSRQPFGRVPAIDDDGYKLFESRAICHYLAASHPGPLMPSDPRAFGLMEQYLSIETSEFSPNAMKFVYEHIFKRPQPEGVLSAAGAALEVTAGVLDKRLKETAFLAGETFTLADISLMPYFGYALATPAREVLEKHPALMAWWHKVSARPSWKLVSGS